MNWTATKAAPVTVYYCKANKSTGKTVRVLAPHWTSGQLFYRQHDFNGVHLSGPSFLATMLDGNSTGAAKRSGARCVLLVEGGVVEGILT
ncbi:MAG: hypothetical protein QOE70_4013 [Chthoniobacter sp.]|jgi:hypothetical protein|nr:hypothetical protein [Chthoniobacter sp.]